VVGPFDNKMKRFVLYVLLNFMEIYLARVKILQKVLGGGKLF